ncbi:MAG: ABC transporter substrate-binding protein, partial [Pseudomonadota bacterium]
MSGPSRRPIAIAAWVFLPLFGLLSCAEQRDADPDDAVRLVSLGPHLTELAYTAGAGDNLVGAIAYSDYPAEARALPRVGDAFAVDREALVTLRPTHVLAWVGGNPDSMLDTLRNDGFNVVPFETRDLSSVATHLRQLGAISGNAQVADAAAFTLRTLEGPLELKVSRPKTEVLNPGPPCCWRVRARLRGL